MADLTNEMAYLRHLATSGDKMADALIRVFDDLRNQGKEVVLATCASTANIASLSTLLTIDGHVTVAGDIVLVKDQSTSSQNGLYVASAGAWTRLVNYNNDYVLSKGMFVFVNVGTTNTGTLWNLTTFTAVGSAVAFTQFAGTSIGSGAIAAAQLSAGLGAFIAGTATIAVGTLTSGHIDCTVQLKDVKGTALGSKALFRAWVSDAAAGAATSHSPTTTIGSGTAIILDSPVANKVLNVVSAADGSAVIRVADVGQTYILNVAIGDTIVSSGNIAL